MSRTARKLRSQNFLYSRELVNKLIRNSSISQNDSVLEIGSGKGIITEALLGVCKEVTAIESDTQLFSYLKLRFSGSQAIALIASDFLTLTLPTAKRFKVFSNLPFSITGEVVKKLLFSKNPPVDTYLVIQKEAAVKFIAKARPNTMLAMLFYPWFDIRIIHKFQRRDFKPAPLVDCCLARMTKRELPLIGESFLTTYRDFIVYNFNRDRSASSQSAKEWLRRFGEFDQKSDARVKNKVRVHLVCGGKRRES